MSPWLIARGNFVKRKIQVSLRQSYEAASRMDFTPPTMLCLLCLFWFDSIDLEL